MATLQQQNVESWDDDLDFEGPILAQSTSSNVKTSTSSRLSVRSESNAGVDDDWQVPLSPNDECSINKAISSAKEAGIPIPQGVPSSALIGGSIKRLGQQKKSKPKQHDDWGDDLELPDRHAGSLTLRPVIKQTPSVDDQDDFDDWAEGSLGVRFGGTRRASRNRSSSASAMSPSLGSILTMESDDEGLGGLVLPTGPLDFTAALKKRQETDIVRNDGSSASRLGQQASYQRQQNDDFFDDLDFGPGDLLDSRKRTLNRNVKPTWKAAKEHGTPAKTQTTITFTDKASTRIPRPVSMSKPARLEPVLETGTSSTGKSRRPEPTTTSAQLLKSKRSMPLMRNHQPSLSRAPSVPFLPAGHSYSHSHHISSSSSSSRTPQVHARRESDGNRPMSPTARPPSRLSTGLAPETPKRMKPNLAPSALAREAASKRSVTRPTRRRNFGDGSELDNFDDLPTSAVKENRFVKQPSARPPPQKYLRSHASQSRLGMRDRMTTPLPPSTPKSPVNEGLPRFARDTAASRIAREQTIGQPTRQRGEGVLTPRLNWPAQVAARSPRSSPNATRGLARKGPTLINPMGKENARHFQDDAAKKGMRWNSTLCRWEGNDHALHSFEPAPSSSPPRPALITNMAGAQGVQVVGGMVFDPQRMCWLKMGASRSDPRSPSMDEDDDPFQGIEDLQDAKPSVDNGLATGAKKGSEWLVGEEFDLGPEFIRRQREEEMAWRSRVGQWFQDGAGREHEGEAWKWAIRELATRVPF